MQKIEGKNLLYFAFTFLAQGHRQWLSKLLLFVLPVDGRRCWLPRTQTHSYIYICIYLYIYFRYGCWTATRRWCRCRWAVGALLLAVYCCKIIAAKGKWKTKQALFANKQINAHWHIANTNAHCVLICGNVYTHTHLQANYK